MSSHPQPVSAEVRRGRGCFGTALIVLCALVLLFGSLVGVFFWNNRPVHIDIPTRRMPRPNAWDGFFRAGTLVFAIKHPGPVSSTRPLSSWTMADYRLFIADSRVPLVVFRQALGKPYRHPPVRSMGPPFPCYARHRELARTLLSESMYYERRGEYTRAMESKLDCIEFGVILPRGGPLWAGIVGSAIESIGQHHVARLLPRLTPAELRHVAARLETIESRRVSFAEVMAEEADAAASMLVGFARNPEFGRTITNPGSWFKEHDPYGLLGSEPRRKPTLKRGWANLSFAFGNKTKMIREIHDYYVKVGIEQNRAFTGRSKTPIPTSHFAEGSIDQGDILDTPNVRASFAAAESLMALLRIEVALRRYRADHGGYPARLKQLRPTYLKSIPYDPFGGKALHYRVLRSGQDFLLYSVGPDLRDNRGKGAQRRALGQGGDIVLERK